METEDSSTNPNGISNPKDNSGRRRSNAAIGIPKEISFSENRYDSSNASETTYLIDTPPNPPERKRSEAQAQDIKRAIERAIERTTKDNSRYGSQYGTEENLYQFFRSDSKSRGLEDSGAEVIKDPSAKLRTSFYSDSSVEDAENAYDTSLSAYGTASEGEGVSEGVSEDVSLVTDSYHSDSEDSSKKREYESDNESSLNGNRLSSGSQKSIAQEELNKGSSHTGNTSITRCDSSALLDSLNNNSHSSQRKEAFEKNLQRRSSWADQEEKRNSTTSSRSL